MPTRTQSTVVAVFHSQSDAQAAVDDLKANGFQSNELFTSTDTQGTASMDTGTGRAEPRHREGGIKGWFKSIFGQDEETESPYYENAMDRGNVFVSVDVSDEDVDRAADILNRHSPIDIHHEAGQTTAAAVGSTTGTGTTGTRTDQSRSIPVVEEELKIGKRAVMRGGVRVYSRVIEEPVEESVRLQEERVRVERTPVDRPAEPGELRRGQEQVVEVKEYAEEPVVSKQARVTEEVRVSKDATERTETIRDTVRRTEVEVENLSEGSSARSSAAPGLDDTDFRRNFDQYYAGTGANYDTYAPAYRYGYEMAEDPRYKGRTFDQVEPQLRDDYNRRYPDSTWERMKESIRYGWNKLTNKI